MLNAQQSAGAKEMRTDFILKSRPKEEIEV